MQRFLKYSLNLNLGSPSFTSAVMIEVNTSILSINFYLTYKHGFCESFYKFSDKKCLDKSDIYAQICDAQRCQDQVASALKVRSKSAEINAST